MMNKSRHVIRYQTDFTGAGILEHSMQSVSMITWIPHYNDTAGISLQ